MGKLSKLKSSNGNRYEYPNGDRKVYDRTKGPDGVNEDIWQLAGYFKDKADKNRWPLAQGVPIIYSVLYERIQKDKILATALDNLPGRVVASSSGIQGTCEVLSTHILIDMIDYYYDNYNSDKEPSIDNFCSIEVFSNIRAAIISSYYIKTLKPAHVQEALEPVQIARPNPLDKPPLTCYDGSVSAEEADLQDKLDSWRDNHNELGLGD